MTEKTIKSRKPKKEEEYFILVHREVHAAHCSPINSLIYESNVNCREAIDSVKGWILMDLQYRDCTEEEEVNYHSFDGCTRKDIRENSIVATKVSDMDTSASIGYETVSFTCLAEGKWNEFVPEALAALDPLLRDYNEDAYNFVIEKETYDVEEDCFSEDELSSFSVYFSLFKRKIYTKKYRKDLESLIEELNECFTSRSMRR
jgi:hypothetical protein